MKSDEMRQFIESNYPITAELVKVDTLTDEEVAILFSDITSTPVEKEIIAEKCHGCGCHLVSSHSGIPEDDPFITCDNPDCTVWKDKVSE